MTLKIYNSEMLFQNSCHLRNGSFDLHRMGAYFLKVMHYSIQDQKSEDQDLFNIFLDFRNLVPLRNNEIFFCGRGWHRLWICKHLRVRSVQCRIIAKHVNSNLKSTYLEDINILRFLIGRGMSFIRSKIS